MNLIIKGLDMPKEASSVTIEWWDENDMQVRFDDIEAHEIVDRVIEIPTPHGRLGDLDVLLEESLKEGAYNYVDSWQIANAPTILEAEE